MLDFFRAWLARRDMDDARRDELARQLLAFANDAGVQDLIAARAGRLDARRVETRLLLLEVMGQAAIAKLPDSWTAPLQQALDDADERDRAPGRGHAARACRSTKRPLVSRVDAQINFPHGREAISPARGCRRISACAGRASIRCPRGREYTFYTNSDDGSELFIDGQRGGRQRRLARHARATGPRAADRPATTTCGSTSARRRRSRLHAVVGLRRTREASRCRPTCCSIGRARAGKRLDADSSPGLTAEFYELGGPAGDVSRSGGQRVRRAAGARGHRHRPADRRARAGRAAAVTARLASVEPALFGFLLAEPGRANAAAGATGRGRRAGQVAARRRAIAGAVPAPWPRRACWKCPSCCRPSSNRAATPRRPGAGGGAGALAGLQERAAPTR